MRRGISLRASMVALMLVVGAMVAAPPPLPGLGTSEAEAAPQKRKRRRGRRRAKRRAPPPKKAEPAEAAEPASDLVPNTQFRGPTRIDFDDRLIQGQTNKSGAVYLFDRKETGIKSMVRRRKSFRHLTIQTIYDDR